MKKFELTPEILRQAAQCETVEDILAKAKEYDEDITPEQAQRVFELSHAQSGAVSDEELDSVSGGGGCDSPKPNCPKCNSNASVVEIHLSGSGPSGEYLCCACGSMF